MLYLTTSPVLDYVLRSTVCCFVRFFTKKEKGKGELEKKWRVSLLFTSSSRGESNEAAVGSIDRQGDKASIGKSSGAQIRNFCQESSWIVTFSKALSRLSAMQVLLEMFVE